MYAPSVKSSILRPDSDGEIWLTKISPYVLLAVFPGSDGVRTGVCEVTEYIVKALIQPIFCVAGIVLGRESIAALRCLFILHTPEAPPGQTVVWGLQILNE